MTKRKTRKAYVAEAASRRAKKAVRTRQRRALVRGSVTGKTNLTEKQFNALPKATQRVLLALDILAMIRAKQVHVETGSYMDVYLNNWLPDEPNYVPNPEEIQANSEKGKACLLGSDPVCTVCAKGGLVLAHIMRADAATVDEVDGYNSSLSITARLVDDYAVFDQLQLEGIEAAFEVEVSLADEHGIKIYDEGLDYDDACELTKAGKFIKACANFGRQHLNEERRLAAIMINIVKNSGQFIPGNNVMDGWVSVGEVAKVLKNKDWGIEYVTV